MFNKIKALENLEARVADTAIKLSELGYAPFPVLVLVDRLDPGIVGHALFEVAQIVISEDYYAQHEEFVLQNAIVHELAHLYVNKYFPHATDAHGPEFKKLMADLGCTVDYQHDLGYAKRNDVVTAK